jgi:hypothetical protein
VYVDIGLGNNQARVGKLLTLNLCLSNLLDKDTYAMIFTEHTASDKDIDIMSSTFGVQITTVIQKTLILQQKRKSQ